MVECFEKEIIVDGLGSLTVSYILAHGIHRVCDSKISERDIGGGDIEIAVEVALYLLKTLYTGQYRRMQSRKDFAREQIFLIRQHLRVGVTVISQKRVDESALSGRGFQKTFHLDTGIF